MRKHQLFLLLLSGFLWASATAQTQMSPALERWKVKAEHGDAAGQFWVGAAYESGEGGVRQDFRQALAWLSKSASQGNPDAQNLLGQMFEGGKGVPQDYSQAAKWYRSACEHRPDLGGAGQGCNNLGLMYLVGRGVNQSRVEAYKYFKLASSAENAALVKSDLSADELAEAERQLEEWLKAHPD